MEIITLNPQAMRLIPLIVCSLYIGICFGQSNNCLVPNAFKVSYTVNVDTAVATLQNYPENVWNNTIAIEKHGARTIYSTVYDNAETGNVPMYYPWNGSEPFHKMTGASQKTIDKAEFLERSGKTIDTVQYVDNETGSLEYRVLEHSVSFDEMKEVLFYEEWDFDPQAFTFTKRVMAYEPIMDFYRDEDRDEKQYLLRKKTCLIQPAELNDQATKAMHTRMEKVASVTYEFPLYSEATDRELRKYGELSDLEYWMENAPLLNRYSRASIIDAIVGYARNNEAKIKDYASGESLSFETVELRFGKGIDTINVTDVMTGEEVERYITVEPQYNQVRSLLFSEDIFIDPVTLTISKTVHSVALVREHYADWDFDMENPIKSIIFQIDFNDK